MSEIQKALATATDCEPSKRKDETIDSVEYKTRLCGEVARLSDADWNALDPKAQDWYNATADALTAKKDLPDWPDVKQAEAPVTRRRGAASEPEKDKEPARGDTVNIVTSRDREYTGKIVELDKDGLVLDVDGKDVDLDHDKIKSIKVVRGDGPKDDDAPDSAEPEVGDTVQVVTKRDKTILGNVTEITDTEIVIKDAAGETHEFDKDRLKSVVVKSKNSGGAGAGKTTTTPGTRAPKTTKEDNGGVAVTVRIRELICENPEATKDDIAKALKKETLEFKDNTLGLVFADTHKVLNILRTMKKLK